MTNSDWICSIEELAGRVAETFGNAVAANAFRRFGAHSTDDLNPAYYTEVYSDLLLIDSDR